MPATNPMPTTIDATNPPANGPTGQTYGLTTITPQDMADGVSVFTEKYQGGPQTVRAAMDVQYHDHEEKFFAVSERAGYEYLQVDANGAALGGRPIYTVRHDEVVDEIAAAILTEAFANDEICIEYPISRKTQEVFSREIRLLSNGIITSGAEDFSIAIDNADSATKRKRHGFDSEMIQAMADLIARQDPVSGFIYSSTGPGNIIIESLRRCGIQVGKCIKTADSVQGFARLTTQDVAIQWDRAYSHRVVALNHAWKYNRNDARQPDLIDIALKSAILDPNRFNMKIKEPKLIRKLREKIKQEQKAEADRRAASGARAGARGRAVIAATPTTAVTMPKAAVDPAARRAGVQFCEGGFSAVLAKTTKTASARCAVVTAILTHDLPIQGRPTGTGLDDLVAFALTDQVDALTRKVNATAQRARVYSYGAFAYAHVAFEAAAPAKAATFFPALNKNAKGNAPATVLMRRLQGMTKAERTPYRVLDYTLQAWAAHVAGSPVNGFTDSAALPAVAGAVPAAGANDNGGVAEAAA